ncbi:MAG: hypothetical protein F7B95_04030 [Desulfurococcales archaeon]|nr:hypothetical protein [Desulfurococcales archaeon]
MKRREDSKKEVKYAKRLRFNGSSCRILHATEPLGGRDYEYAPEYIEC